MIEISVRSKLYIYQKFDTPQPESDKQDVHNKFVKKAIEFAKENNLEILDEKSFFTKFYLRDGEYEFHPQEEVEDFNIAQLVLIVTHLGNIETEWESRQAIALTIDDLGYALKLF